MKSILKFKELLNKIFYVSDFTNVENKTLRILASIIFANLSVALDIFIIITFSNILIGEISYENQIIILAIYFISEYEFIFPILVILRFSFLFFEKTNL